MLIHRTAPHRLNTLSLCFLTVVALWLGIGCDYKKPDTAHAENFKHLIIPAQEAMQNMQRTCAKNRDCTPPLTCNEGRCGVPPAVANAPNANTPTIHYVPSQGAAEESLVVELARDDYERELGLMFRRYMHEDWGMLFVFPGSSKRSFWMQHTYIPLDIIFIREDGSVANVRENAAPLKSEIFYESTDPVKYVLELNGGAAQKRGIRTGIRFKDLPK